MSHRAEPRGTSGSEKLLQQVVMAGMEQSLGGPAQEGAPSPRLPAVLGGEKTAGRRREVAARADA